MNIRFLAPAAAFAVAIAPALLLQACGSSTANPGGGGSGGVGGVGGSGGEAPVEAPDYDKAFPQDRVPRLDITIQPGDWQAMLDDMTSMLGTFGSGTLGGGMGFPDGGFMPPDGGFAPPDGGFMPPDGGFIPPDGGMGFPGNGGSSDLLPRTPVYVECDAATADRKLHHVGIRLKGNSSLATPWMQGIYKLPLRLTFDRFEDKYPETKNQRLYGFKALNLSNGSSDPSLLRDKIGTEVFADAGLPAPATAFYRVFIDHGEGPTYFGLYTGIELPSDDAFLDTHFVGHDGNLYKPDGKGATWASWDPDTLGKENHEATADYSDAQGLYDALHADRTDAVVWRNGLEARLQVDEFLHWLALNTVIQDWDSYGRMSHNYFLYADPALLGMFRWIPWDHSYAFTPGQALSLSLSEVDDGWPLIRYLLDDPSYRDTYRSFVSQAAQFEFEPTAAVKRFQAAHDLIAPYVVGSEGEIEGYTFLSSPSAFDDGLAALIAHAQARPQQVADYLAQ